MKVQILTYVLGEDPKKVVLDKVSADVEKIDVYGSRVLIATAPTPDRSKGGIMFADKTKDEGRFQGKVGLILKMGASAFKYNGQYEWEGGKPKVGDWVFYRNADTQECGISEASCRIIYDDLIIGKVSDPEVIW